MAKIYLIRHGESIANTQSIYQGQTYDTELSELGFRQAEQLAQYFQNIEVERIIASPLQRTWQTAEAIARKKNLFVEKELSLIETNHGLWEGKHKDEIAREWPRLYKKWQKFPSSVQFPEGEHFLETQKRVRTWWQEFMANCDQEAVVVTHYNIIQIIVAQVMNMKLNRIWRFGLQPTSISCVEVVNQNATIKHLNQVSHLEDLESDLAKHAL